MRHTGSGFFFPKFCILLEMGSCPQFIDAVGLLPGQVQIITTEVAISCQLTVDRAQKVQIANDGPRPQVKHLRNR